MNESELNNNENTTNTYHATTNLNIDMENPQMRMDSAVGMNIQNLDDNQGLSQNYDDSSNYGDFYKDYSNTNYQNNNIDTNLGINNNLNTNNDILNNSQNLNTMDTSIVENKASSFIPTNLNSDVSSYNEENTYTALVQYAPTMEERKKRGKFEIPTEVKVTAFIIFILLIFVLLMPYLYDFIKGVQLRLTR